MEISGVDRHYRMRDATANDLEFVLRHRMAMFRDMGTTGNAVLERIENLSRPFFQAALEGGTYRGWLVEDLSGAVVAGGGVILLSYQPGPTDSRGQRAFIVNLYTEPEHRRRGLARRLMQTMVTWCRQEGFHTVSLHASAEGRRLYESMGFLPTNEMRFDLRQTG